MPITLTVTGDNATQVLHDLRRFISGYDDSSKPEAPFKTPLVRLVHAQLQEPDPVGPVLDTEGSGDNSQSQDVTEQKKKRRNKTEMEAARVFDKYVVDHGSLEGEALLAEYGITDVADIGPERAEHFIGRAKCGPNPSPSGNQPDTDEDLVGSLDEAVSHESPDAEPWLLKGADGNRYDAYATPEEWCESLAALIASADTAAEIKALATVNAGIKDRMEAAGKIDLLRDVIDGGRIRMSSLEAKPAGDASTVQDCAAALRAYLDPNRTSKLTSDERTRKASEILKVQFGAPKVASLKPEQYAAFIAALADASMAESGAQ